MPFLCVKDLCKRFGERAVLDGASLDAEVGDTVAILGPSGSGKSTLLNVIGALTRPDAGSVIVDGVEVTALSGSDLARYRSEGVGFVFQDHHLLPQLTAAENVLLPVVAAGARSGPTDAERVLDRVGVSRRAEAFPWEMSGGERQRTALARALINRPKLLLCDEPTGNLDQQTGSEIIDLLLSLASDPAPKDRRVTVVMVTHNLDHASRFARRLALSHGRLTAES